MLVEKEIELIVAVLPASLALVAIALSVNLGFDRQRLAWVLVLAARYLATIVWCAAAWGVGRLMRAGASGVR